MKRSTLGMLDAGLFELENYAKQNQLSNHENLASIPLCPDEISSLRDSLRKPTTIDIDRWSVLLHALQQRAQESGGAQRIDVDTLLTSLSNFRSQ